MFCVFVCFIQTSYNFCFFCCYRSNYNVSQEKIVSTWLAGTLLGLPQSSPLSGRQRTILKIKLTHMFCD